MVKIVLRAGVLSICALALLIAGAEVEPVRAFVPIREADIALSQDGPGSRDLEALAEAVRAENNTTENYTAWAGGELSPPSALEYMPEGVEVGRKLTSFAFPTFRGDVAILDRIDAPVLINFWASWCGPCIDEFPALAALALDDMTPFTVLFVNIWDDEPQATAFLESQPADILAVRDERDAAATAYGLVAIPTSFLVDENGVLQVVHVGNVTDVVAEFLRAVALSGQ